MCAWLLIFSTWTSKNVDCSLQSNKYTYKISWNLLLLVVRRESHSFKTGTRFGKYLTDVWTWNRILGSKIDSVVLDSRFENQLLLKPESYTKTETMFWCSRNLKSDYKFKIVSYIQVIQIQGVSTKSTY